MLNQCILTGNLGADPDFFYPIEDSSGTIIITDFKTSARAYPNDEADRNFQITLYQIAAKANGYYNRDILLKYDRLIKKKTTNLRRAGKVLLIRLRITTTS